MLTLHFLLQLQGQIHLIAESNVAQKKAVLDYDEESEEGMTQSLNARSPLAGGPLCSDFHFTIKTYSGLLGP